MGISDAATFDEFGPDHGNDVRVSHHRRDVRGADGRILLVRTARIIELIERELRPADTASTVYLVDGERDRIPHRQASKRPFTGEWQVDPDLPRPSWQARRGMQGIPGQPPDRDDDDRDGDQKADPDSNAAASPVGRRPSRGPRPRVATAKTATGSVTPLSTFRPRGTNATGRTVCVRARTVSLTSTSPARSQGAQPRGDVDGPTDIPVRCLDGLAGVDADANGDGCVGPFG